MRTLAVSRLGSTNFYHTRSHCLYHVRNQGRNFLLITQRTAGTGIIISNHKRLKVNREHHHTLGLKAELGPNGLRWIAYSTAWKETTQRTHSHWGNKRASRADPEAEADTDTDTVLGDEATEREPDPEQNVSGDSTPEVGGV